MKKASTLKTPLKKKTSKKTDNQYSFEISLSVLNHLGRNLYRSFVTVLGEAISNAWDADAKNVWIVIDKKKNTIIIKDDGLGMGGADFQNKFLKIGYSKRKDGTTTSKKGRPFIGRKGIGKLALLSCADQITVVSKKKGGEYIGGVIDNSGLDQAITNDLTPQQYKLGKYKIEAFSASTKNHSQGTIIAFKNIKGGIRNSLDLLKKIVALYFRFSLLDKSFNIYIDGDKITIADLKQLSEKTEFLWTINSFKDPYADKLKKDVKEKKDLTIRGTLSGFVASVEKPKDLNIMNLDERVSVDLFVNGRLREKNILKHIPTARIVEDYLYGQIHFNALDDDGKDRFTSDREGVISDDEKYLLFLKTLKEDVMRTITDDWDKWRRKHKEDGDKENLTITPKERKSDELFNVVSTEYSSPKGSPNKEKIDEWVDSLSEDARFNFASYAECFISENLIRKYIDDKGITLSPEAQLIIEKWKKVERESKDKGNISIQIRKTLSDLSYLAMNDLANLVDKAKDPKKAALSRDSDEYKPMRDSVAHTALLSDGAKNRLTAVFNNIQGRIKKLLQETVSKKGTA